MSTIESKAPATAKATRTAKSATKKSVVAENIEAALAKAVRKTATLGQLELDGLNVRKKKPHRHRSKDWPPVSARSGCCRT